MQHQKHQQAKHYNKSGKDLLSLQSRHTFFELSPTLPLLQLHVVPTSEIVDRLAQLKQRTLKGSTKRLTCQTPKTQMLTFLYQSTDYQEQTHQSNGRRRGLAFSYLLIHHNTLKPVYHHQQSY